MNREINSRIGSGILASLAVLLVVSVFQGIQKRSQSSLAIAPQAPKISVAQYHLNDLKVATALSDRTQGKSLKSTQAINLGTSQPTTDLSWIYPLLFATGGSVVACVIFYPLLNRKFNHSGEQSEQQDQTLDPALPQLLADLEPKRLEQLSNRVTALEEKSDTAALCERIEALRGAVLEGKSDTTVLCERIDTLEKHKGETDVPISYLLSGECWRWNQWREKHPDQTVLLAGIDLTGKSLCGFNLSHANLSNATLVAVDFDSANLTHTDFSKANLNRSSFVSADLSFADLRNTNLQHSNLYLAQLNYAQLDGADLNGCSMSSAKLLGASLIDTTLTSANLTFAIFRSANLTQVQACFANLQSADFTGAILVRADLSHSNFRWTKVAGADITDTNFTSALLDCLLLHSIKSGDAIDSHT